MTSGKALPRTLRPKQPPRHLRPTLLLATLLAGTTALCAAAEPGSAGAVETHWILSKLARPAPMRTAFVELRDSKLLKAPLRIEGEYRRPADDTLVREVRAPYAETTTIRAGTVSIARAGKSPRTFSLTRVPELAGLQSSFGALLSGDRTLLEQHYRLASSGTRPRWMLTLTPRDAQFAARVRDIVLYGRGAELRCIETTPTTQREVQRTLLAGAARDAAGVDSSAGLAKLCHGESASR
jgi:hypothetical protein